MICQLDDGREAVYRKAILQEIWHASWVKPMLGKVEEMRLVGKAVAMVAWEVRA